MFGGFISLTLPIFELPRLPKSSLSRPPKSSSFREVSEVTLALNFVSFFVLRLFSPQPSTFYFFFTNLPFVSFSLL